MAGQEAMRVTGSPPRSHSADSDVSSRPEDEVVEAFFRLYGESQVWTKTLWLGTPVYKCPLDLWVYQEILFRTRPDIIIETGTWAGGSALFLASICDLLDRGRVITIDIEDEETARMKLGRVRVRCRPTHPRITYLCGSSVAEDVVSRVRSELSPEDRVMLVLDSDHSKEHVLAELRAYTPFVTENCYAVVEDTMGDQLMATFGGPGEAVEEFCAGKSAFTVDRECEKFLLTWNPGGYLRRESDNDSRSSPAGASGG
jgi:cephalosporin hydroxylase